MNFESKPNYAQTFCGVHVKSFKFVICFNCNYANKKVCFSNLDKPISLKLMLCLRMSDCEFPTYLCYRSNNNKSNFTISLLGCGFKIHSRKFGLTHLARFSCGTCLTKNLTWNQKFYAGVTAALSTIPT